MLVLIKSCKRNAYWYKPVVGALVEVENGILVKNHLTVDFFNSMGIEMDIDDDVNYHIDVDDLLEVSIEDSMRFLKLVMESDNSIEDAIHEFLNPDTQPETSTYIVMTELELTDKEAEEFEDEPNVRFIQKL